MNKLENVEREVKVRYAKGYFIFKLGSLLIDRDMSINELSKAADLDYSVIRKYLKGNIIRIDLGVIERLCTYFHCPIDRLIAYEEDENDM